MSFGHSSDEAYTENAYDNHTVARTPELRAGIITSVILAFIVVLLRVYTRHFIVKRFGPDDYLVGAAMVCSIDGLVIGIMHVRALANNTGGLQLRTAF